LLLLIFVLKANMARNNTYRAGGFTLFFAKCVFSQHTRCELNVDGQKFHSALHYMLYEKASEYRNFFLFLQCLCSCL